MIDPVANEAALRHLAAEIQRLQLLLAQALGNLALAVKQRDGALSQITEKENDERNNSSPD